LVRILLIVGVPLYARGIFLPLFLRTIGAILAGVSFIWMGLGMSGGEEPVVPKIHLQLESLAKVGDNA
jgi:hypothetical protein